MGVTVQTLSDSSLTNSDKFEELSAECVCCIKPAEPIFSDLANYGFVHDRKIEVLVPQGPGQAEKMVSVMRCARYECTKTAAEQVAGVWLCYVHAAQYARQLNSEKAVTESRCPNCEWAEYYLHEDGVAECDECNYTWTLPWALHPDGCECETHYQPCAECGYDETINTETALNIAYYFCPECEYEWNIKI